MSNAVSHDHIRVLFDKQHLKWDAYIPEFVLQAQTVTATLGRNNFDVHKKSPFPVYLSWTIPINSKLTRT